MLMLVLFELGFRVEEVNSKVAIYEQIVGKLEEVREGEHNFVRRLLLSPSNVKAEAVIAKIETRRTVSDHFHTKPLDDGEKQLLDARLITPAADVKPEDIQAEIEAHRTLSDDLTKVVEDDIEKEIVVN